MTTTRPAVPAWDALEAALRQRRAVRVSCHGHQRLICPHALGWKNGKAMLLGYQTGGHTTSGTLAAAPKDRWRNFFADDIDDIDAVDAEGATTWQTAANYNAEHPFNAMDELAVAATPTGPDTQVG